MGNENMAAASGKAWRSTGLEVNTADRLFVSGAQIGADLTAAFANSAAANTQQVLTVNKPDNSIGEYALTVYNPSTVTDLTVKIFAVELDFGDALLASVAIPKSQAMTGTTVNTHTKLVHGIFAGTGLKIVISNDTVLGGADGFAAKLRLREVQ